MNRIVKIAVIFSCLFNVLMGCKQDNPSEALVDPKPSVKILKPLDNATVIDSFEVVVEASDDKGVTKVELFFDNRIYGKELLVEPYKWIIRVDSLRDNTKHLIFAKAYDADDNKASSKVIEITALKFTPSNFYATLISDSLVELSWVDNSSFETGFEIERSINGNTFSKIATLDSNSTRYSYVTTISDSIIYLFRVRAYQGSSYSGYSNIDSVKYLWPLITIQSPTSGDTLSVGKNEIKYTARDNYWGQGLDHYDIFINDEIDTTINVTSSETPPLYLSIPVSFIEQKISYYLVVYNKEGSSKETPAQENILVKGNTGPPQAPDSLLLTKLGNTDVLLLWRDNSLTEDFFEIWRSTDNNQNYSKIATVAKNGNSFRDIGLLLNAKIYYYKIRAVNAFGSSGYSNEVSTGGIVSGDKPTNLKGEALGATAVLLTWQDNSSKEAGFEIQYSTSTSDWTFVGAIGPNTEQYTVTGLVALTTYSFRIGALVNPTVYSDPVTVTTARIDVAAPTQLEAKYDSTTQTVTLSWNINTNLASTTLIERKVGGASKFTQIGSVAFSGSPNNLYYDTDLTQFSVHTYRVRHATTEGFNTKYSNEASVIVGKFPPLPPTNLTIQEIDPGIKFRLEWTDNSTEEDEYRIYQKNGATGSYFLLIKLSKNTTLYDVSGLQKDVVYYFKVSAFNSVGGESKFSNEVVSPLPTPTNFSAVVNAQNQVELSWDDNALNERGYKVERRFAGGGSFEVIHTTLENVQAWTDTGVFRGTTYEYRIYAFNDESTSAKTESIQVTVPSK